MDNPIIAIEHVWKTYGAGDTTVHALRDVSVFVERGDYVAIMGASGSGKSTLMNLIGCLDMPTSGRYLIDGVDVRGMAEGDLAYLRNRGIGLVFPELQPRAAHLGAAQRRAAAASTDGCPAASVVRARSQGSTPWALPIASGTCRRSSPADSSSAWRSHAPSSPIRG